MVIPQQSVDESSKPVPLGVKHRLAFPPLPFSEYSSRQVMTLQMPSELYSFPSCSWYVSTRNSMTPLAIFVISGGGYAGKPSRPHS